MRFDRERPTKLAQSSVKKLRLEFNECSQIAKFCTKVGVNDYKSGYLTFTFVILCHFDKKIASVRRVSKKERKISFLFGLKLSFLVVLVLLFESAIQLGLSPKIALLKVQ